MGTFLRRTVVFLAALLAISSCGKNSVIPKGTLSKIYADMLLTDAWLRVDLDKHHEGDSLLVYEAVFNKYGYTTSDYWNSVDHYMKDPDKFAKILDKAADRLENESLYVEAEKVWTDAMESYRKLVEKEGRRRMFFTYDSVFVDKLAPRMNPLVSLDTTVNVYLPEYDERRDSVRTDIQPKTRQFIGDQSSATEGEALQL